MNRNTDRNAIFTNNGGDRFVRRVLSVDDDALFTARTSEYSSPKTCTGEKRSEHDEGQYAARRKTWGLDGYPLAIVYSPVQEWRRLYEPSEALDRGTLFKELYLPFEGGEREGGGCRGR